MPQQHKRRISSSSEGSDVSMGGMDRPYAQSQSKRNRPSISVTTEDDVRRELELAARAAANEGYSNLSRSIVDKMTDPLYHKRADLLRKAWTQLPPGLQSTINANNVNFDLALQCLEAKRHAAIMRRAYVAVQREEEAAAERQRQIDRLNRMNLNDEHYGGPDYYGRPYPSDGYPDYRTRGSSRGHSRGYSRGYDSHSRGRGRGRGGNY